MELIIAFFLFAAVIVLIVRWGLSRTPPARKQGQPNATLAIDSEILEGQLSTFNCLNTTEASNLLVGVQPLTEEDSKNLGKRGRLTPLQLVYINSRDEITHRLIEPVRSGATVDYFDAYCHLDETKRSFRFDRATRAVDAATGEVLSPSAIYRRIHPKRKAPDWLSDSA